MNKQYVSVLKECEGCNFMDIGCCFLYTHVMDERLRCPCNKCIVKMMCNRMCSERTTLYTELCDKGVISWDT